MANQEQYEILKQGMETWNHWRKEHAYIQPDLSRVNLSEANLREANLSGADLSYANLNRVNLGGANLSGANLSRADLGRANLSRANLGRAYLSRTDFRDANLSDAKIRGADLRDANLSRANLSRADFSLTNLSGANLGGAHFIQAYLSQANLSRANLREADLREADLSEAYLSGATLVRTNLADATLTNCNIYGIAAWSVELKGAKQNNLVITPWDEPAIAVDNLKIAQFIYLLLNNAEIRDVIDTIARKAVLILGRFTLERKTVLDALRDVLRIHGYLPILFDFEKPSSRNFTETLRTLAHLSRFIIADLTAPSSIPQELQAIIPTLAVPVQPVLLEGEKEYAMFIDFLKTYHWVLPVYYYIDLSHLLATLKEQVIEPAEQKAQELEKR